MSNGIKQATEKIKAMAEKIFGAQHKVEAMEEQKKHKYLAAKAALSYLEEDMVLGIGTGSTVDCFIEELAAVKHKVAAVVASSKHTAAKIKALGIPIVDLNTVHDLPLYIDGADEVGPYKRLIKGGGGALTQEKIIATAAKKFICIVDQSKRVDLLGSFPVPVEVIPLSRSYVARQLVALGGDPVYREGFVTDNGNVILDVYNLKILDPVALEQQIDHITGVVENGIFAQRTADVVLVGTAAGVEKY